MKQKPKEHNQNHQMFHFKLENEYFKNKDIQRINPDENKSKIKVKDKNQINLFNQQLTIH